MTTQILWIDDEADALYFRWQHWLQTYDININVALTVPEALERANSLYDLVFFDIGMDRAKTSVDLPVARTNTADDLISSFRQFLCHSPS